MKFSHLFVVAFFGALLLNASVYGGLLNGLSEAQVKQIQRGEQVVTLEEIKGKPWPRISVYQKANASPKETAAVFFDYEQAKTYVPKVLKSNISRRISPCVMEVDYGLDVPILPDEFYTVKSTAQKDAEKTYRFSWILLRALQAKASEGSLLIEPFEDKAVMRYTNLVIPNSRMAIILKGPAIEQVRQTVRAIAREVETQKTSQPQKLVERVEALEKALAAEGS